MPSIILSTLNARYSHTAFGLRYLYANLAELQPEAEIVEFTLGQRPADLAEQLLARAPAVIGFGVYIWNALEIAAVAALLKQIAPHIIIALGGPEVSHPPDLPPAADHADYIITGDGEFAFRDLCRSLLAGGRPAQKIITGGTLPLAELASPYPFYSDQDIRQRIIYVEASRGCPFKCEFCLSALDKTAKPFPLDDFLAELARLHARGARRFKFIDRTFNLKIDASVRILAFFLERLSDDLFLHFEVIPDHLPPALQQAISRFPPGALQLEIGVQTFDTQVQQLVSRKQNNELTEQNLRWLRRHSAAHVHADLIAGLPGDDMAGFAASFDRLYGLGPQEIQVGILKRLRGAPINRHTDAYAMRYDPNPPYAVLSTRDMSFYDLQRLQRFARFWDLLANSGRFSATVPLLLAGQPFDRFMRLSEALYQAAGGMWQISLKRLFELCHATGVAALGLDAELLAQALEADFARGGEKSKPDFLRRRENGANLNAANPMDTKAAAGNRRQRRFQAAPPA